MIFFKEMKPSLKILLSEIILALFYVFAAYFWLSIVEILVLRNGFFSLETFIVGAVMLYGFLGAPKITQLYMDRFLLNLDR